MSKRSLGRGLNDLMEPLAEADGRSSSGRSSAAHPPGLRHFLRPPEAAATSAQDETVEPVSSTALPVGAIRASLIVADVTLVGLAGLLMTRAPAPGWREYGAVVIAVGVGCWLSVLAAMLGQRAQPGR